MVIQSKKDKKIFQLKSDLKRQCEITKKFSDELLFFQKQKANVRYELKLKQYRDEIISLKKQLEIQKEENDMLMQGAYLKLNDLAFKTMENEISALKKQLSDLKKSCVSKERIEYARNNCHGSPDEFKGILLSNPEEKPEPIENILLRNKYRMMSRCFGDNE